MFVFISNVQGISKFSRKDSEKYIDLTFLEVKVMIHVRYAWIFFKD